MRGKTESALLWKAVKQHDVVSLRNLLETCTRRGCLSDCINSRHKKKGKTLLMIACKKFASSCIRLLLDFGANADLIETGGKGNTALHYAVLTSNNEALTLLIQSNANPFILNADGHLPLDIARFKYNADAIRQLITYTIVHCGYLYVRKAENTAVWKKQWCVATKCNPEGSSLELSVFRYDYDIRPLATMILNVNDADTNIRDTENDNGHSLIMNASLLRFDHLKKRRFSREFTNGKAKFGTRRLRRSIGINYHTLQHYQFAAEDDQARDQWRSILGPVIMNVNIREERIVSENDHSAQLFDPIHESDANTFIQHEASSIPITINQCEPSAPPNISSPYDASIQHNYSSLCDASAPSLSRDIMDSINLSNLSITSSAENTPYVSPTTSAIEELSTSSNTSAIPTSTNTASTSNTTSRNTLIPPSTSIQTTLYAQNSSVECVVCMDAPRNSICVPCGHFAGCYPCLSSLHTQNPICPICRANVTTIVRVYHC